MTANSDRAAAIARGAKARQSKLAKKAAISFKVGDAIRTISTVKPPKYANVPGEVVSINGEEQEVQAKTSAGRAWFAPRELLHDDDPVLSDDDEVLEFDDDEGFEEE